jgi:hypothetical protein
VQGFLFAEPMSLSDVEQLFRDNKLSMQDVA